MPDLGAKICDLLDIKLHHLIMTAWKKVEALRAVLEDSKKTPDKSVYLDLAEHAIDYDTRPFIDVKVKGATVKKLTLNVTINLKLKGFSLKVQNGSIREIQLRSQGSCEVRQTLDCRKETFPNQISPGDPDSHSAHWFAAGKRDCESHPLGDRRFKGCADCSSGGAGSGKDRVVIRQAGTALKDSCFSFSA